MRVAQAGSAGGGAAGQHHRVGRRGEGSSEWPARWRRSSTHPRHDRRHQQRRGGSPEMASRSTATGGDLGLTAAAGRAAITDRYLRDRRDAVPAERPEERRRAGDRRRRRKRRRSTSSSTPLTTSRARGQARPGRRHPAGRPARAQITGATASARSPSRRADGPPARRVSRDVQAELDKLAASRPATRSSSAARRRRRTSRSAQMFQALGLAMLLMYMLMVALLREPALSRSSSCSALPLAVVGAFAAWSSTGNTLNMMA